MADIDVFVAGVLEALEMKKPHGKNGLIASADIMMRISWGIRWREKEKKPRENKIKTMY